MRAARRPACTQTGSSASSLWPTRRSSSPECGVSTALGPSKARPVVDLGQRDQPIRVDDQRCSRGAQPQELVHERRSWPGRGPGPGPTTSDVVRRQVRLERACAAAPSSGRTSSVGEGHFGQVARRRSGARRASRPRVTRPAPTRARRAAAQHRRAQEMVCAGDDQHAPEAVLVRVQRSRRDQPSELGLVEQRVRQRRLGFARDADRRAAISVRRARRRETAAGPV